MGAYKYNVPNSDDGVLESLLGAVNTATPGSRSRGSFSEPSSPSRGHCSMAPSP